MVFESCTPGTGDQSQDGFLLMVRSHDVAFRGGGTCSFSSGVATAKPNDYNKGQIRKAHAFSAIWLKPLLFKHFLACAGKKLVQCVFSPLLTGLRVQQSCRLVALSPCCTPRVAIISHIGPEIHCPVCQGLADPQRCGPDSVHLVAQDRFSI